MPSSSINIFQATLKRTCFLIFHLCFTNPFQEWDLYEWVSWLRAWNVLQCSVWNRNLACCWIWKNNVYHSPESWPITHENAEEIWLVYQVSILTLYYWYAIWVLFLRITSLILHNPTRIVYSSFTSPGLIMFPSYQALHVGWGTHMMDKHCCPAT